MNMKTTRIPTTLVALSFALALLLAPAARAADSSPSCVPYAPGGGSFCSDQTVWDLSLHPTYRGWAQIAAGNSCTGDGCGDFPPVPTAYRWSGGAWHAESIWPNTRVYAWPYSGGYHWVWTRATGWLAIRSSSVYVSF